MCTGGDRAWEIFADAAIFPSFLGKVVFVSLNLQFAASPAIPCDSRGQGQGKSQPLSCRCDGEGTWRGTRSGWDRVAALTALALQDLRGEKAPGG